ncbi:LacI family DNA-binding transcriptional regulator [Actibacterium sp. 188UL27-1]|uniref:LacI family DNA-binding transcriptional regulator n=1 Tax=Actibacterium sp. 188UL27-1 TaxID=2786961 RepID=UPI00351C35B4
MNDIARVAGVSLATVDRVLNDRPGVRKVTIAKVQTAIDTLGYIRDTAAANLARKRVYTILFILPATGSEFVAGLEEAIRDQSQKLALDRTQLRVAKATPFDPQQIVAALDAVDPHEVDGIALFGPETPSIRDAVRRIRARGVAVVALVSDLPSSDRDHFVGIDNLAAGRTAAQLMGRFLRIQGTVLVLTGSRLARDHLERRQGFDLVMADEFPGQQVVASVEGRDDPALINDLLTRAFDSYPDLVGIYASAADHAGLIQYLSQSAPGKGPVVVAHELTPMARRALRDGVFDAVINQDRGHLVRSAVRVLRANVDGVPFNPTQERIRIDIYLKENLPA